ncbi:Pycsar system effector family protein [Streptomyces sp. NBC_00019]|uniref:Pycsar system effector family protein n=1 Tax=Streptomyces sp. NBC_00019 TaxID=2975623 RepID=UPI0032557276
MTEPEEVSTEAEARAIETAWRIHAELGNWTAKADAKASFALTLDSAATAGIVALSNGDHVFADLHGWSARSLLWSGIVLIIGSGLFAMLVVVPRLRARKVEAEAASNFIYFGHLKHRQADELANALKETDILPVLSKQLITMSKIAWDKHRHVQLSFVTFGLGVALAFLSGLAR